MKTLASAVHQRIAEIALDTVGPLAASASSVSDSTHAAEGAFAPKKDFATRAASIYSGTNEAIATSSRAIFSRELLTAKLRYPHIFPAQDAQGRDAQSY